MVSNATYVLVVVVTARYHACAVLAGWGKGGNVTSAGWQVILCDPIWHVSSRSGGASRELLYSVYFTYFTFSHGPVFVCVCVCHKSVFYRKDKCGIIQTTPLDSPGTLVF